MNSLETTLLKILAAIEACQYHVSWFLKVLRLLWVRDFEIGVGAEDIHVQRLLMEELALFARASALTAAMVRFQVYSYQDEVKNDLRPCEPTLRYHPANIIRWYACLYNLDPRCAEP